MKSTQPPAGHRCAHGVHLDFACHLCERTRTPFADTVPAPDDPDAHLTLAEYVLAFEAADRWMEMIRRATCTARSKSKSSVPMQPEVLDAMAALHMRYEQMRAVVNFYSLPWRYESLGGGPPNILSDGGDVAREALWRSALEPTRPL